MSQYEGPRKFNVVSVLVILGLLAGVYCVWQFGPPYWTKWQVKEVLDDTATRFASRIGMMNPDEEGKFMRELSEDAKQKIRQEGVDDPRLQVRMQKSGDQITVVADYRVVIHHPLVDKETVLGFHPFITRRRQIRE